MDIARLTTAHFEFVTIGETRSEALDSMRRGWDIHREQTGADYEWSDLSDDVDVTYIVPGECVRDGSPINPQRVRLSPDALARVAQDSDARIAEDRAQNPQE